MSTLGELVLWGVASIALAGYGVSGWTCAIGGFIITGIVSVIVGNVSSLTKCRACRGKLSKKATICPHCGEPNR